MRRTVLCILIACGAWCPAHAGSCRSRARRCGKSTRCVGPAVWARNPGFHSGLWERPQSARRSRPSKAAALVNWSTWRRNRSKHRRDQPVQPDQLQTREPLEVVVERPHQPADFFRESRDQQVGDRKALTGIGSAGNPVAERLPGVLGRNENWQRTECPLESTAIGLGNARPQLETDRQGEGHFVGIQQFQKCLRGLCRRMPLCRDPDGRVHHNHERFARTL